MSIFCVEVDDAVKRITTQNELNVDQSEDENAIMVLDQHQNNLEQAESQSSGDLMVYIKRSFRFIDLRPFQFIPKVTFD